MAQPDRLGMKVGGHLALVLYSSDESGELSEWQCHDDYHKHCPSLLLRQVHIISKKFQRNLMHNRLRLEKQHEYVKWSKYADVIRPPVFHPVMHLQLYSNTLAIFVKQHIKNACQDKKDSYLGRASAAQNTSYLVKYCFFYHTRDE